MINLVLIWKILGEVSNIKDYDNLLKFLTNEYENWIEEKTNEIMDIDPTFAEFSLIRLKNRHAKLSGSNPCQLSSCPWCGHKLSPYEYYIGGTIKQLRVTCKFRLCTFNSKEDDCGIPILSC